MSNESTGKEDSANKKSSARGLGQIMKSWYPGFVTKGRDVLRGVPAVAQAVEQVSQAIIMRRRTLNAPPLLRMSHNTPDRDASNYIALLGVFYDAHEHIMNEWKWDGFEWLCNFPRRPFVPTIRRLMDDTIRDKELGYQSLLTMYHLKGGNALNSSPLNKDLPETRMPVTKGEKLTRLNEAHSFTDAQHYVRLVRSDLIGDTLKLMDPDIAKLVQDLLEKNTSTLADGYRRPNTSLYMQIAQAMRGFTDPISAAVNAASEIFNKPKVLQKGILLDVEPRTTVRSVGTGQVSSITADSGGKGRTVAVDTDGYSLLYGSLDTVYVVVGQEVDHDQPLGVVGNTAVFRSRSQKVLLVYGAT